MVSRCSADAPDGQRASHSRLIPSSSLASPDSSDDSGLELAWWPGPLFIRHPVYIIRRKRPADSIHSPLLFCFSLLTCGLFFKLVGAKAQKCPMPTSSVTLGKSLRLQARGVICKVKTSQAYLKMYEVNTHLQAHLAVTQITLRYMDVFITLAIKQNFRDFCQLKSHQTSLHRKYPAIFVWSASLTPRKQRAA